MDWRVLPRIAAPLALTMSLAGMEVFGVSSSVRYSVMAALTLVWLVYAWAVLRHDSRPQQGNQAGQLEALRAFVKAEVQGSRIEIERTRGLIRESVAKLGGSFEAVNRESRRQGEVVARLIDRSGDGDNAGAVDVYRFALHASRQMEQLVEALEAVGDQNSITVTHIDTMAGNLEGIFGLLEAVGSVAAQTQRLALSATSSAARVREAVSQIAARDIDRSCGARVEAATMLKRVDSINCGLSHGMREVAACRSTIDGSVADAVRLLQFEDIAAQSLTAASMHLDRLGAINEATTLREPLDRSGGGSNSLDRPGQRKTLMRSESKRLPHKPVRQRSMDAGSVELF